MRTYIRWMDSLSRWFGVLAACALFAACMISAGNAVLRYAFSMGSNAWLEVQWYLFGIAVFAGAPILLKLNEHVRVDVLYGGRSPRTQAWIDVLGLVLVLLPLCAIVAHLAWPFVVESFQQQEHSPSAGGLIRWPIKAAMPVGFALLGMQALAELFRRIEFLRGRAELDITYERPLQ
jgi:TRAP-type mannitol/chloroaromatic compound transport system permease small subunit